LDKPGMAAAVVDWGRLRIRKLSYANYFLVFKIQQVMRATLSLQADHFCVKQIT
jgi:hypothetical protein